MACIRTALALIGFGCGAGKFYGDLDDAGLHERLEPIRSTLSFGASFEGLIARQVAADKPFWCRSPGRGTARHQKGWRIPVS